MKRVAWLAAVALLLCTARASAHPLEPGLLALEEQGAGRFVARFRPPRAALDLRPLWPAGCHEIARPTADATELDCGATPLAGSALGVAGLAAGGPEVLARLRLADGRTVVSWLRADAPHLIVPERASRAALLGDHARLGMGHLLGGLDHILFVTGLVVLLRRGRPLWLAVTAFTAGHATTLACAVLGSVRVPAVAIEPAIAATLVWLAHEIAKGRDATAGRPLLLPYAFGLLHGLGFASALDWLGVARADLPVALAGFNLGIEAGQLVWIAALAPLLALIGMTRRASLVATYAIGSLGVYFLLTRLAAITSAL